MGKTALLATNFSENQKNIIRTALHIYVVLSSKSMSIPQLEKWSIQGTLKMSKRKDNSKHNINKT